MDYKKLYQEIVEEMVFRMNQLEKDIVDFDVKGMKDAKDRTKSRLDEMIRLKDYINQQVLSMQEEGRK